MRDIRCYRRGCDAVAVWKFETNPVLYVCTKCLRDLPRQEPQPIRVEEVPQVGPTEVKGEEDK